RRLANGERLLGRHGPPPARDRSRRPAVREVRWRDAAGTRHGRWLVRQRGLELGEPRVPGPRGWVPPAVGPGMDLRRLGTDARLVQIESSCRRRGVRLV